MNSLKHLREVGQISLTAFWCPAVMLGNERSRSSIFISGLFCYEKNVLQFQGNVCTMWPIINSPLNVPRAKDNVRSCGKYSVTVWIYAKWITGIVYITIVVFWQMTQLMNGFGCQNTGVTYLAYSSIIGITDLTEDVYLKVIIGHKLVHEKLE